VTKDNVDYLDDFDHAQHGDNVFTIQQVKEATALCVRIRDDLETVKKDVVDNAESYVPEPDDSDWPVAKS
jgi:hypothetical protein